MSWELLLPAHLLWALLPLGIAAYFLVRRRDAGARELFAFCLPAALEKHSRRLRWVYRAVFLLFLGSLLGLAWVASRPVLRQSWTERSTEAIDILIALDVSVSMEADDFLPSRMDVAKKVIRDFIQRRKYDRIGLVQFSGEAMTLCPLTRDHEFLLQQVNAIELRKLKVGTAIGMGLSNALLRLRKSQTRTKIIVLLTDGDSNVGAINPVTAAQLARQEGVRIYTIAMGQKDRVLVSPTKEIDDYGTLQRSSQKIPSYLNPKLMNEIAETTGGRAYMARDTGMLVRILQEIDHFEKTHIKMLPKERILDHSFVPACVFTAALFMLFLLLETRLRKGERHVPAV